MARSNWMAGFNIKKRAPVPLGREPGRLRASAPRLASGEMARALYVALKAHAARRSVTLGAAHERAGIGASTMQKLRAGKPVTQAVVLKVCNYLGVNVADMLTNTQQQESKSC